MMNRILAAAALILPLVSAQAFDEPLVSAVRGNSEHWLSARNRNAVDVRRGGWDPLGFVSVESVATTESLIDVSKIAEFNGSEAEFLAEFKKIRDTRFLEDPNPAFASFARRLSWLYPDDGCFARAEWMAKLFRTDYPTTDVSKIFVFGNLTVKTTNAPYGEVNWWYHVVAGWRVNGKTFVYDPAIYPERPLTLSEWLGSMSPDPSSLKVSICSAGAFTPSSNCTEKDNLDDSAAKDRMAYYLSAERSRLGRLTRDTDAELGDLPPWLNPATPKPTLPTHATTPASHVPQQQPITDNRTGGVIHNDAIDAEDVFDPITDVIEN